MKRIFIIVTLLASGAALAGVATQGLLSARAVFASKKMAAATQAELAAPEKKSTPPQGVTETGKTPDGLIDMAADRIAAQEIEVAPVEGGVLARLLSVPGTVILDADLVARVPARVVGTVTQMRKRLGDSVTQGEVVAVLDSREVADAKSEYLTASVAFDLDKTMFERSQVLWAKRISAEQQYLQARAKFLETELRTRFGPAETFRAQPRSSRSGEGGKARQRREIRCLKPSGL